MRLSLERNAPMPKDCVLIEPDGTVFMSFMQTGFIKAISRTKYASGDAAATGAFVVSSAQQKEGDEGDAMHALTFVSEVAGDEKIVILERFHTKDEADAAWSMVHRSLRRYVVNERRKRAWRTFLRYVGVPFIVLAVGMAMVRYLDSHNGSLEALNAIMRAAGTMGGPQAGQNTSQQQGAQPAASATAPISDAANAAVVSTASQMASIHFGLDNQPPEKTLYVYSDPNCPACKQFEAHINDLAKDFSVYVLPVAYQGDDHGKAAANALCAKDQQEAWGGAVGGVMFPAGSDCLAGYTGVKANMQQFERLGFNSTPRVVSGTGFIFPEGAPAKMIRLQAAEK
ncbi:thioredoxin fold domain-containing protein [Burkholderia sp. Tr-862]|uniref:thioredoxin fold domain-containing protein n=1 Tax=Burkholderia sp. Tr-862 TaxID=2608331 RepID=UPI001419BD03|nr:thioredoxin fold domain-containing protein [Burkholderia sp. Tr-862]NIF40188.1 thioredoxin fold domain-containing protein [Burkholderia sp. Tr-862]